MSNFKLDESLIILNFQNVIFFFITIIDKNIANEMIWRIKDESNVSINETDVTQGMLTIDKIRYHLQLFLLMHIWDYLGKKGLLFLWHMSY